MPKCFHKLCAAETTSSTWMWQGINWQVNPFLHTDALWRHCSRQLFENIMTKGEKLAFFSFCHSVLNLYSIIIPLFVEIFSDFAKMFCIQEPDQVRDNGPPSLSLWLVNPFSHIDAFRCLYSRQLFENIVTKEEIAQNKQFLLLPQCFPL